jgi:hypothetical protein
MRIHKCWFQLTVAAPVPTHNSPARGSWATDRLSSCRLARCGADVGSEKLLRKARAASDSGVCSAFCRWTLSDKPRASRFGHQQSADRKVRPQTCQLGTFDDQLKSGHVFALGERVGESLALRPAFRFLAASTRLISGNPCWAGDSTCHWLPVGFARLPWGRRELRLNEVEMKTSRRGLKRGAKEIGHIRSRSRLDRRARPSREREDRQIR